MHAQVYALKKYLSVVKYTSLMICTQSRLPCRAVQLQRPASPRVVDTIFNVKVHRNKSQGQRPPIFDVSFAQPIDKRSHACSGLRS